MGFRLALKTPIRTVLLEVFLAGFPDTMLVIGVNHMLLVVAAIEVAGGIKTPFAASDYPYP